MPLDKPRKPHDQFVVDVLLRGHGEDLYHRSKLVDYAY
jgi:hypothetical protein